MEDSTPYPGIHLNNGQGDQPFLHLVVPADSPPDLLEPLPMCPEVPDRHEDRERFLDGSQAVEGPLAVNYSISGGTLTDFLEGISSH
jgi:hypothetical protein